VADCPKSSRDVLMAGFAVLNVLNVHRAHQSKERPTKDWLDGARKKLVSAERVLLYQTGCRFSGKTVNECLVHILRDERLYAFLKDSLPGDQELATFSRLCNTLSNSSARIPLVLQHDPRTIAATCVWIVLKLLKLPDERLAFRSRPWYLDHGCTAADLRCISEQLLPFVTKRQRREDLPMS